MAYFAPHGFEDDPDKVGFCLGCGLNETEHHRIYGKEWDAIQKAAPQADSPDASFTGLSGNNQPDGAAPSVIREARVMREELAEAIQAGIDNQQLFLAEQKNVLRLVAVLSPFVAWLDHIEATGSRRLEDHEAPAFSGIPNMGQLRKARSACADGAAPYNGEIGKGIT